MDNFKNAEWLKNQYVNLRKKKKQIASECGVSLSTITNWLKKFNIDIYIPYKDEKWLYEEIVIKKRTSQSIGEEFNVDRKAVDFYVNKFNIKKAKQIRPRMPKGTKITVECSFCHEGFLKNIEEYRKSVDRRNGRVFCSRKCADEAHRIYISGENNPNFGGKWHGILNNQIPKEILRERGKRSVEKRKQSGVLDEQIKKMRDASLKYYSTEEGKKKRKQNGVKSTLIQAENGKRSSIEIIIREELNKIGINYIEQYEILYWVVDFYVPENNLIIEVNGDYWHGNSKVFKNLNATQRKNKGRDKAKETYSRNHGYNFLTLWETDIKERLDWCVNQIKEAIRTVS